MKIQELSSAAFKKYGKIVPYDLTDLLKEMENTPMPADEVIYVGSDANLEKTKSAKVLQNAAWGEHPIEVGYCNGYNRTLNAVEYHRNSEINVAVTDMILLIGMQQDITDDFHYDTSKMEAFLVPAGTAVEIYGTTLHYAPISVDNKPFRVSIVLPKGTNDPLDTEHGTSGEDRLLAAKNKWLIAHEEAGIEGAFAGLVGENITI